MHGGPLRRFGVAAAALVTIGAGIVACNAALRGSSAPTDGAAGTSDRSNGPAPTPDVSARRERPARAASPLEPTDASAETAAGAATSLADEFTLSPADAKPSAEPRVLRGRVTAPDGSPLAGVVVEANATWLARDDADASAEFDIGQSWCGWTFTGAHARAVTAADGTFALRCFDGAAHTVFIRPERDALDVRFAAFDPPLGESLQIDLGAPGAIEGSVALPDGTPAAEAEVGISVSTCPSPGVRDAGMHHCDPPQWSKWVQADSAGRWECDGVPLGDIVVTARAAGPGPRSDPVRVRTVSGRTVHAAVRVAPASASGSPETVQPDGLLPVASPPQDSVPAAPAAPR